MKRFAQTWPVLLSMLALGPLLGSQSVAAAQATDPASVASAFGQVFLGDPEAALAMVTDDAVVRIIPPPQGTSGVWSGKSEIRQWLQFVQGQNVSRELVGVPQVDGNKVTVTLMVNNNDFRRFGTGPVKHTGETVVEGGKVKSYTSIMDPSERPRVAAARDAYLASQPPAGMPRTGGTQSAPMLLLLTLCMLAVVVGLGISRTKSAKIL